MKRFNFVWIKGVRFDKPTWNSSGANIKKAGNDDLFHTPLPALYCSILSIMMPGIEMLAPMVDS